MPKLLRYGIDEAFPLLREYAPHLLGDPLHFTLRRRRDKRQDQRADPLRVGLGVGERERAAPRHDKHGPPIDAAAFTESLDVGYEMLCRIGAEIGAGIARQRPAATRAALIEKQRIVKARVEEAALTSRTTRAGAAMEKEGRLAGRVAAAF